MEKCYGGDLYGYFKKCGRRMKEKEVKSIVKRCLGAILVCHNHDIVHNDVKPQNFLFSKPLNYNPNNLKLIDFGISIKESERGPGYIAVENTPLYCSPEGLCSKNCKRSDVWAIGVMTHLLLTGVFPFNDHSNPCNPSIYKIVNSILKSHVDFDQYYWHDVSESGKNFVRLLLEKDFEKRPDVASALMHPWMSHE
jgi:serine/threonine protein kinase